MSLIEIANPKSAAAAVPSNHLSRDVDAVSQRMSNRTPATVGKIIRLSKCAPPAKQ